MYTKDVTSLQIYEPEGRIPINANRWKIKNFSKNFLVLNLLGCTII